MSYNSYHKQSSSYNSSSGLSRGRGFSTRGSFRGRGADSTSSWSTGSTSRGRGFSGPSRGRFNWYKEHSSGFDSRSRYASGSSTSGAERYSSRGRGDDSGYRRYSRGEGAEYSPRDHSHHRSPESQRKRLRTEHGYVQASSTRRSHEGGYGGGTDYNSRYSYSEEKGNYGEERGRGYREERRSAGSFRDRSREDYPHRKLEPLDSSMPPPSSVPPRHVSSPRGSFRGRLSRGTRGISRMMLARRADTLLARKRSMMDSYSVRKRILTARTQAENLKRLKIQKMRRLREAAASKKEGKEKEGASAKATEDISDEEEKEENWDEDEEKAEDEEELEEGETPDKKEKVKKVKKEPKSTSKDEEPEEGEEVDDEEEEEEEEEEENEEDAAKKSDVKNDGGVHVTIKQDSDARAVSEEVKRTTFHGRPFIRLSCPHCFMRCVTFKEYSQHLYSSKHINAMRKQSLRHKQTLARMRMTQRQKQRLVEENEEVHGSLSSRTKFCPICKLNYRQLKSKHQTSQYHREMRKFLMPYCTACRMGFTSPMLYENHICSLDHIKRKARLDESMMRLRERSRNEDEGSGMEEDDKELNMDNFMILDSVGTVDGAGDDGETDGEGKSKNDKDRKEGEEKKSKIEINLGAECIKKVEVYFCELCHVYLPRLDQPERALAIHCRIRAHLQRYVRHRDDRALRREAERIHRKEMAKEREEKEAESKKNSEEKKEQSGEKMDEDCMTEKDCKKCSDDTMGDCSKKKEEGGSETSQNENRAGDMSSETVGEARADGDVDLDQDLETGMDDKLWADVDKDLGELLREVEPGNKSSDEDDDSRAEGGRYDRFRYSEKGSVATTDPASEGDAGETTKVASEGDDQAAEPDVEDKEEKKKTSEPKSDVEPSVKKASVTASTPTPVAAATN